MDESVQNLIKIKEGKSVNASSMVTKLSQALSLLQTSRLSPESLQSKSLPLLVSRLAVIYFFNLRGNFTNIYTPQVARDLNQEILEAVVGVFAQMMASWFLVSKEMLGEGKELPDETGNIYSDKVQVLLREVLFAGEGFAKTSTEKSIVPKYSEDLYDMKQQGKSRQNTFLTPQRPLPTIRSKINHTESLRKRKPESESEDCFSFGADKSQSTLSEALKAIEAPDLLHPPPLAPEPVAQSLPQPLAQSVSPSLLSPLSPSSPSLPPPPSLPLSTGPLQQAIWRDRNIGQGIGCRRKRVCRHIYKYLWRYLWGEREKDCDCPPGSESLLQALVVDLEGEIHRENFGTKREEDGQSPPVSPLYSQAIKDLVNEAKVSQKGDLWGVIQRGLTRQEQNERSIEREDRIWQRVELIQRALNKDSQQREEKAGGSCEGNDHQETYIQEEGSGNGIEKNAMWVEGDKDPISLKVCIPKKARNNKDKKQGKTKSKKKLSQN